MTRVDFYVLAEESPRGCAVLACRLTDKAWNQGHSIFIHSASAEQARDLDELLWTFRDRSFLPHRLADTETADEFTRILIGHASEPAEVSDLLINLAPEVPLFFSRFARVAELVDANPARRSAARDRYQFYRDRGYALQTHKLPG